MSDSQYHVLNATEDRLSKSNELVKAHSLGSTVDLSNTVTVTSDPLMYLYRSGLISINLEQNTQTETETDLDIMEVTDKRESMDFLHILFPGLISQT